MAMVLIASGATTGNASQILFSDIPQTYNDLYIYISGRTNAASTASQVILRMNGSSSSYSYNGVNRSAGANYIYRTNNYNATSIPSMATPGNNATTNYFGPISCYFPNYAGSGDKLLFFGSTAEINTTNIEQSYLGCAWSENSAVTSISITVPSTTWFNGTTYSLYGTI